MSFADKSDKWSKAWCRTLYRLTLQELEHGVARHLGSCRWMSQAGASQRLYNPKLPVARPRVMQELFGASALLPLARRLSVQVGCAKGSKYAKQERSSVLRFFCARFVSFGWYTSLSSGMDTWCCHRNSRVGNRRESEPGGLRSLHVLVLQKTF